MNLWYKTYIALTLATVAIFKTKAQTDSLENAKDSVCYTSALAVNPYAETEISDSLTNTDAESFTEISAAKNNKSKEDTPWENTPEGSEIVATWMRLWKQDGIYNSITEDDVATLKKINETSHLACALAEALKDYEMDGEDMLRTNTDSLGLELDRSAKMEANGPGDKCFRWFKHIVCGTNPIAYLEGDHAYQAADGLRKSPNVVETKTQYEHMDKIIPSGMVIFGRGLGAIDGHVFVAGKGDSNHIKSYTTEWGRKYWYNPARDVSDRNRKANTSGLRGNVGRYARQPVVFLPKGATVSGVTMLKIGYQYARKNSSQMFISTEDVYHSILQINEKSAEMMAQKILNEKNRVKGFEPAQDQLAYHKYPAPRAVNPRGARYTKVKTPTTEYLFNRRGSRRM